MVDWRHTASRVRNSISSRHESSRHHLPHPQPSHDNSSHYVAYTTPSPNHIPTPVASVDATSTSSSVSRVPGAFYIPNSIAQRASVNMPPADGAALRRQLAFDALALVRELPCHCAGWVLVKRDLPKFSALFRSQWIPFWGELRGGMLLFCDPNSDYVHENKRQIKLVFTATNCIIDLKNTSSYSQIKLRRPDGQCLVLRVSTPNEAQHWCVSLQTHTFQYTTIRLSDFDWITAIGKGASGKVFLVRDNRTNARLALKVIDKSRVFRTSLTFQHVINERMVLEMCSGCPFLIQLRYAFQTDSHLYFATDFYDGGDVFSLLQSNRGRLSENHARRIIAEIVLALSWLHERNVVYRDLKPENVVLDGDGHVRLADFGLAKLLKSDYDYLTQTICGTTAYAAPEMLQSNPYNVSLDLWCLGIFIYHVLSGRTPFNFKGKTMEEMEEMQRNKQIRFSSTLSLEAVSLIKGLLQIDPFRRSTLDDVKRHPFFRGVDWVRVSRKEPHPDDISRLVSDKDERGTVVARLAVARAQQLGVDSEPATQFPRADVQEVSSMTLDRYLLRNINPEEWRHVSFSDDDDMSATAEFPAVVHKKGAEMETWAIAGWAWTCSEASGYTTKLREERTGNNGYGEDLELRNRMNVANGRRSLPVWNHQQVEERANQAIPGSDTSRPFFGQRASLQEKPTGYLRQNPSVERTPQPIDKQGGRRVEPLFATEQMVRNSVDVRITPLNQRRSQDGPTTTQQSLRRNVAKGVLNFRGLGGGGRDGRSRASLDGLSRARRSLERWSRDSRSRKNEEGIALPCPIDNRQVKSSIEVNMSQIDQEEKFRT